MALIEIDGLPIKNGGSFHGYVTHNQMVASDLPVDEPCQACWPMRDIPIQWGIFNFH